MMSSKRLMSVNVKPSYHTPSYHRLKANTLLIETWLVQILNGAFESKVNQNHYTEIKGFILLSLSPLLSKLFQTEMFSILDEGTKCIFVRRETFTE